MTNSEERRLRAAEEAADWADRFALAEPSPAERAAFVDWLRESPLHVAEMLRIERLRATLQQFPGWADVPPATGLPDDTVVELLSRHADAGSARAPRRRPRALAFVAGVAAVLLLGLVTLLALRPASTDTRYRTEAGERREITLADGSLLQLAPATVLSVRFERALRSVALERGRAIFHVAKDAHRPFVVAAASTRVQAVGTIFAVQRDEGTVIVTVAEGRVRVRAEALPSERLGSEPPQAEVALGANERITVTSLGQTSAIAHVDARSAVDWESDRVTLENTSVGELIERYNRVNRLQIRLEDPALAGRTVSGVFNLRDPDSLIAFLKATAPLTDTRTGDDAIVLGRAGPPRGSALPP